jgi:hypothetical protein
MEEEFDISSYEWEELRIWFKDRFGKKPDMNAILYLIGIQELGKGVKNFTKEEKQDLMHIAVCKLLSISGYYEFDGIDEEGWPHWKLNTGLPPLSLKEQEVLLKKHIIEYFKEAFS